MVRNFCCDFFCKLLLGYSSKRPVVFLFWEFLFMAEWLVMFLKCSTEIWTYMLSEFKHENHLAWYDCVYKTIRILAYFLVL